MEQLRDPRMNVSVVRPLVDRCYEDRDLSMGVFAFSGSDVFKGAWQLTFENRFSLLPACQPNSVPPRTNSSRPSTERVSHPCSAL